MNKAGVYVHLPFCLTRCPYCSFLSQAVGALALSAQEAQFERYLQGLLKEAQLWQLDFSPATLYLGGGTPTVLGFRLIPLIEKLKARFALGENAEITVEANPHSLSPQLLKALFGSGVRRLSLGLQSSHNDLLTTMGRSHTWQQFLEVWEQARAIGFDNLSVDLIYGLPGQSLQQWEETLSSVGALQPDHISLYALTVEEGAPWASLPETIFPEEDLVALEYELATEKLKALGFEQYELSNWARGGKESQHNLLYWTGAEYLGLGAGAHSFLGGVRLWNTWPPERYLEKIAKERRPLTDRRFLAGALGSWAGIEAGEELDSRAQRAEALILRLRLVQGVDLVDFAKKWGFDPRWEDEIKDLVQAGLLKEQPLRLTLRGRLLANQVFLRFLV